jgi:transcription factor C subunit 3
MSKIPFSTPVQSPTPSSRAGRPKGSLNKSKMTKVAKNQISDARVIEEPPEALDFTPSRSVKSQQRRMDGLSRKERFEARGMDETWTEYNVLLIDRPAAGVYVTPQGKRRPAGKRQGRPRQSRIAVFKSDKLASFPWFVKDDHDSDNGEMADLSVPGSVTLESTPLASTPPTTRRSKRTQAVLDQTDSSTPPEAGDFTLYRGRNVKRARLDANVIDQPEFGDTEDSSQAVDSIQAKALSKNGRDKSAAVHPLSVDVGRPAPKRRRIGSPDRVNNEDAPSAEPNGSSNQPIKASQPDVLSKDTTPSVAPESPKGAKRHAAADRGGSISIVRRKIIMEIVEKAGGAYPSGNEIWYPFVTFWMKYNRKERPDMRTIKTSIKNLVDSGKLRQLTFSGKDLKGVMVTRTILAKPDISPNDPLVKGMQQQVLATDPRNPRISYSPHVDVDPILIRTNVPITQRFKLPVIADTTVHLQHKPAFALYEEKRQERQVNRALMRQLEGEISPSKGKTKRLLTTQRQPVQGEPSGVTHTSIARPAPRPRGRPRIERPVVLISAIGSTSLLMNPGQTFHPQTGTFATGARLVRARPTKIKPAPMLPNEVANSVEHLTQLARQTEDPSSTSDKILKWELNHEEFFDAVLEHHPYIDQGLDQNTFHAAPIAGTIRFDRDQPAKAPPIIRPPNQTRKARRSSQVAPRQRRLDAVDTSLDARKETQRDGLKPPLRRQRFTATIPDPLYRKIMAAIVVVRVLAGGWEARVIDWDLVSAAFPSEEPSFIQDRAKSILSRNRLQILKMQRDFQERFLEAYKKNRVPQIDYFNLEKYNWPAIVEWANIELDVTTSERAPSLPATREQFDSIFELREDPVTNGDELFGTTSMITTTHKRTLTTRVPFAIPMDTGKAGTAGPRKAEIARLEVAKSWVRANIVTPEQAYRPEEARQTLSRFGAPLVESATRSLLTDRIIGMGNRGRIVPGRNYDITDHLLQQINRKRTIECTILRRAVHFKTTVLDPQFQKGDSLEVSYSADDGDILALINLASAGRLTFKPRDPPKDKFGLVDSGYLTRQMDKTKVRFAIDIYPTSSYVYGNPLQEQLESIGLPSPPEFPDDNLPPKIPLWFDIHGGLIKPIWEMAIASVIGCVAMRQGLSAQTISGMIKPALGAWEIELLLGWLADVGVVSREETGGYTGWKVLEFWWMILT